MTLRRIAGLTIALLMVLVGGAWFAQGNGWIGSAAGDPTRAYLGAIAAGLGVALSIVIVQRGKGG